MKDFSNLLERIIFTPSRNSKISIISQFFKNSKDPERGFALAILTGNLKIAKITSSNLKEITKKKVDPILFDLSYDYIGDLAETISLIWPNKQKGKVNFMLELNKLWIHGLIHLFGYDHKKDKEFNIMSKIEKKFLSYIK